MIFNSFDFAVFLPITFILYWFFFKKNLKLQNLLIIFSSYLFYGLWDWKFLSLIFISTILDYSIGIRLKKEQNILNRKLLLYTSVILNLGFLCVFKYFNFFIENFNSVFSFLGQEMKINTLNIILPVGISFYTFQTLSYTIDVYKRKLEPTLDFISFAAFVSFFPQLVAGPIERASNLLPQFYKKRSFNYDVAVYGMRQIIWGLFKKIVIADNCAEYVNIIFNNYSDYSGSTLFIGGVLFSFQIYGDFSGYSDIAIGVSRLFGFNLMQNFAFPYFSRDIAEFWRRWHISLSTWFRDYIYFPLGGSKGSTNKNIRNIFIIFIISGFWHGANWTYVIWGLLNAVYFLPLLLLNKNRKNIEIVAKYRKLPTLKEFLSIILTFVLTVFAWIFFRAENIDKALDFTMNILSSSFFSSPEILPKNLIIIICCFIFVEYMGRTQQFAIEKLNYLKYRAFRWIFYISIICMIGLYQGKNQDFIYFQF